MVRPHILLTLIMGVMLGVVMTSTGIRPYLRWLIFIAAGLVFIYVSDDVLKFADTESIDILSSSTISHRAEELSKSTTLSGVLLCAIVANGFSYIIEKTVP